jgi:hypothetical protein
MSLGQHDHDAMRATNGKLCAPRVRTKPVSRGVHVWNSSHLVARYVLIHVGARNDAHHGALHRRSPTNVRGPVRVGERVQLKVRHGARPL